MCESDGYGHGFLSLYPILLCQKIEGVGLFELQLIELQFEICVLLFAILQIAFGHGIEIFRTEGVVCEVEVKNGQVVVAVQDVLDDVFGVADEILLEIQIDFVVGYGGEEGEEGRFVVEDDGVFAEVEEVEFGRMLKDVAEGQEDVVSQVVFGEVEVLKLFEVFSQEIGR